MRMWITPICSAILIMIAACSEHSIQRLSAEDRAGVGAMTQSWLTAHRDRDWDAVASHYMEDENEGHTTIEIEILAIEGYEDLAYVIGTSKVTLEIPGHSPFSFEGKYLDIRRRDFDGSWKDSVDMFSPNQPVD